MVLAADLDSHFFNFYASRLCVSNCLAHHRMPQHILIAQEHHLVLVDRLVNLLQDQHIFMAFGPV